MRAQSFLRKDWLGVLSIGLLVGLPGPSLGQTSNAPLPPYAAAIAALERFVEQERVDKQLPALSVALVLDQRILWAKGFGFATFASTDEAKAAIAGLDGKEFNGQTIKVSEARSPKDREPRNH